MPINSPITITLRPELNRSPGALTPFSQGEILRVKVVELNGDRALIDFGGFRATADIKVPVTLGEELHVRVLEAGRQVKLGIINPETHQPAAADATSQPRENISDDSLRNAQTDLSRWVQQTLQSGAAKALPNSILNILSFLNSYFEYFELKENSAELISRLKTNLEDSGIFFEKKLEQVISNLLETAETLPKKEPGDTGAVRAIGTGDLKSDLLKLMHFIRDPSSIHQFLNQKEMTLLMRSIETLLADIVNQQGRAVRQLESPEPFQVFTFVLPLKQDGQRARLKVYYQKKRTFGLKDSLRLSLLLSLDRLGDVRTDFWLFKKDLTITFFVKQISVRKIIEDHRPQLKEVLRGCFDRIGLNVVVSKKKVREFELTDSQTAGDGKVDLRI